MKKGSHTTEISVYYLYEDSNKQGNPYVGHTKQLQTRAQQHMYRLKLGYIPHLEVIGVFENRKEARDYENDEQTRLGWVSEKKRASNRRKGQKQSESTKYKIAEAIRGTIRSEETRQKMSISKTGLEFTEEHRKNLSESRKGMEFSEEHRKNLSESLKKSWEIRRGLVTQ